MTSARFARAALGVGLLGCLLVCACASRVPAPAVAEECVRQALPAGGLFPSRKPPEWKSERKELEFAAFELRISPCTEPGGELHVSASLAGLAGIGCWDDAGIELHCLTGRGVLAENVAPRIVLAEGGEAAASAPHFESAIGPWGIWMRRSAPFGPGHRMRFAAVARVVSDAQPRELVFDVEASAHRNDHEAHVFHGVAMKRTVRARIAADCD